MSPSDPPPVYCTISTVDVKTVVVTVSVSVTVSATVSVSAIVSVTLAVSVSVAVRVSVLVSVTVAPSRAVAGSGESSATPVAQRYRDRVAPAAIPRDQPLRLETGGDGRDVGQLGQPGQLARAERPAHERERAEQPALRLAQAFEARCVEACA